MVALSYRSSEMLPGLVAPYKVQLQQQQEEGEGGHSHPEARCVWVPMDQEDLIRSRRRRSGRLRGSGRGADDHAGDDGHGHEHAHDDWADFRFKCHRVAQ